MLSRTATRQAASRRSVALQRLAPGGGTAVLEQRHNQQNDASSAFPAKNLSLLVAASGTLVVFAVTQQQRQYHTTTRMEAQKAGNGEQDDTKKKDDEEQSQESFDIRELWRKHAKDSPLQKPREFWNKVISSSSDDEAEAKQTAEKQKDSSENDNLGLFSKLTSLVGSGSNEGDENKPSRSSPFETISRDFLKLISGKDEKKGDTITEIVATVRERSEEQGGDVEETASLTEIHTILQQYGSSLDEVVQKFLAGIDFSRLTPTALLYYLEYQDEVKNPSYKRRKHRFCPGIDASKADELYDSLKLALLAYADTVQQIQEGLESHSTPYELVYCRVKSRPGQPAHFLAVQRDQPPDSLFGSLPSTLHVTLVVRGTKSVADAITDLLCEETDYMGGKAHSFIVDSGRWVAEQSRDLLLELLESSGKSRIQLTIVGHSLGAGAASIAGMELNYAMKDSRIQAQVVGFGCPALLSKDLAEKADFITTVVNNDDCVPRLSGISVANLLLDVLEFDWLPYAKRDIRSALDELHDRQPFIFNADVMEKIVAKVEPLMEKHLRETILDETKERLAVELFPPGRCVHYYHDGVSFSACFVPNTFFSEIDVSRRMIHGTYVQQLIVLIALFLWLFPPHACKHPFSR